MTHRAFFQELPWSGGLKRPLLFGVLAGLVGALGKGVFTLLTALFVGSATFSGWVVSIYRPLLEAQPGGREVLRQLPEHLAQLSDVLVQAQLSQLASAPVEIVVELFALAALIHAASRWFGGHGSFEATFRVICYANAAQVIKLIPGIGIVLGTLFNLALAVRGLRAAHGLPGGRALIASTWWVPPAALVFLALTVWAVGLALQALLGGG
jgi:hypothetical protein